MYIFAQATSILSDAWAAWSRSFILRRALIAVSELGAVATGSCGRWLDIWSGRYRSPFWHDGRPRIL